VNEHEAVFTPAGESASVILQVTVWGANVVSMALGEKLNPDNVGGAVSHWARAGAQAAALNARNAAARTCVDTRCFMKSTLRSWT
jgi:acetyl-CoA carboxylase carboxyltransferase component